MTTTDTRTEIQRPEPPTREHIEQARREQWRAIQNFRRRILDALGQPLRG